MTIPATEEQVHPTMPPQAIPMGMTCSPYQAAQQMMTTVEEYPQMQAIMGAPPVPPYNYVQAAQLPPMIQAPPQQQAHQVYAQVAGVNHVQAAQLPKVMEGARSNWNNNAGQRNSYQQGAYHQNRVTETGRPRNDGQGRPDGEPKIQVKQEGRATLVPPDSKLHHDLTKETPVSILNADKSGFNNERVPAHFVKGKLHVEEGHLLRPIPAHWSIFVENNGRYEVARRIAKMFSSACSRCGIYGHASWDSRRCPMRKAEDTWSLCLRCRRAFHSPSECLLADEHLPHQGN